MEIVFITLDWVNHCRILRVRRRNGYPRLRNGPQSSCLSLCIERETFLINKSISKPCFYTYTNFLPDYYAIHHCNRHRRFLRHCTRRIHRCENHP